MVRRKTLLPLLLLTSTCCLAAGEHLVPEYSLYGARFDFGYDELLLQRFRINALARVIVVPSFGPEFALGIVKQPSRDGYAVLGRLAEESIWSIYRRQRGQGRTRIDTAAIARDLSIHECLAPLAPALGADLVALWESMVRDTRHPARPEAGRDGVVYHFASQPDTAPVLTGQTWSPPAESRAGKLVGIVDALHAHCTMPTTESFGNVVEAVAAFKRLAAVEP